MPATCGRLVGQHLLVDILIQIHQGCKSKLKNNKSKRFKGIKITLKSMNTLIQRIAWLKSTQGDEIIRANQETEHWSTEECTD